jgi:hypothetical protein
MLTSFLSPHHSTCSLLSLTPPLSSCNSVTIIVTVAPLPPHRSARDPDALANLMMRHHLIPPRVVLPFRCPSPMKPRSHHRFVYYRILTHSSTIASAISDCVTSPFPSSLIDPSHFSRCSHRYASPLVTYAPGVRLDVPTPQEVTPLHVSLTAFHMVSIL